MESALGDRKGGDWFPSRHKTTGSMMFPLTADVYWVKNRSISLGKLMVRA